MKTISTQCMLSFSRQYPRIVPQNGAQFHMMLIIMRGSWLRA